MEPQLDFFAVINTLGVLQCVLTALALFSINTGNQTANRFLGIFLLALAVFIMDLVIINSGYHQVFPYLYGITNPIDYLLFPPLFLYVKALVTPKFQFKKKDLWHFAPFLIISLLESNQFFLTAEEKRLAYLKSAETTTISTDLYILVAITHLYIFAYLFACFQRLRNATRTPNNELPAKTAANIKWIKGLIVAIFSIAVLSTLLDFIPNFHTIDDYITPFFLTIVVYGMGFIGIRQSEIFSIDESDTSNQKYKKSTLTDEIADDILDKLQQLMAQEKLFTDSEISLPKLADQLHVSTHHLSQVLNERLNRSFFNFINEHRIEAAKQKLLDPETQKYTMLELAYEIGFNSLSAFNTAFKKHTGLSPTAYKKENTP